MKNEPITIQTVVHSPIEKVWEFWTNPNHITQWAFASDDWESPYADNDLKVGGKFKTTMAAKDGSHSFDIIGTYTKVIEYELIEHDMEDDRHVKVVFETVPEGTKVTQTFDPESQNSRELQQKGWQSILDNFKKHVEGNL